MKNIMNLKKLKKIRIFLFLFFFSFAFQTIAFADEFDSLLINVDIDKKGIASVEEIWDTKDYEGTEKYKPIENLGQMKIEDFKASVNNKKFTKLEPWDLDLSFEQKAYKYGINYTDNGLELCWGISSYGDNHHVINYKINPIILGLNDYDMLYFQFINKDMDPSPQKAIITISAFEDFTSDVKMWGFGMEGDIHNKDGKIVMESRGQVNYGTVMLRFPKGFFDTSYKIDKNFKDYADMAISGSDWEENEGSISKNTSFSEITSNIIGIIVIAISAIVGIFLLVFTIILIASGSLSSNLDRGKKFPKIKDLKEEYYHKPPYDGPIENLYLFLKKANPAINVDNVMNAFILKWIYENALELDSSMEKKKSSKNRPMRFIEVPENMGKLEESFLDKLLDSAKYSDKNLITQKTFEKYIRKHPKEFESFMDNFESYSSVAMEDEAYIIRKKYKKFLFTKTNLDPTEKGVELFSNLIKFKNYLMDYSLIRERDVNEVKIWDYFMIYAALFGISAEVFDNLRKVYPEYETYSVYDYRTILWARSYSQASLSSYQNFISQGSGGSTSFGGGGGSFGGGSGGGSR